MPEAPKRKPRKRLLIQILVVVALVIVAGVLVLRGGNAKVYWADAMAYWAEGMAVIQKAGPWAFFAAMAILPAVGAPLLAFVLPAAPAFSGQLGLGGVILACGAALAVNLTLTYWVARYALRPWVERLVVWLGHKIPQVEKDEQFEMTLLLQVAVGPPFFVKNYLLGLCNVGFVTYLAVSWSVVMAQIVGYIVFGDALVHGKGRMAVLGVSLLVVAAIIVHLTRKHLGKGRGRPAE